MQGFKKLALVAAIAAVPAASFAMQPMNDSQMSGVTGRDGITLSISGQNLSMNQIVYDRDGIGANAAYGMTANAAGAIVIQGMGVNTNGNSIVVKVDAGQGANATVPVLNVNVALSGTTTIATGNLYVASTNDGTNATTMWQYGTDANASDYNTSGIIASSSNINIGATTLNIQLGNVTQSMVLNATTYNPMIALTTSIANGITITNTKLYDTSAAVVGGGTKSNIAIASTWLVDAGSATTAAPGTNLTVGGIGIDVTTNGLVIGISSLGDANNGMNVYQTRVDLGNGTPIGDVAITNLKLSGTTITIAGH